MSDDSPMEKKLTTKVVSTKPLVKLAEAPPGQKGGRCGNGRQFRESSTFDKNVVDRRGSTPFAYSTPPSSAPPRQRNVVNQYQRYQQRSAPNSVRDRLTSTDADPEVGSVSRPGSKKGALAEFLNFSYDSPLRHNRRDREFTYVEPSAYPINRRSYSTPSYNKEQYLQANCQFVVAEGFDYSANLADPDLLVDWDHVEELRLIDQDVPSCPICLYPPVAAKITRCGHVFCWPCILHYLALSDKQWRKCPICYESVYKNQLRSVVATKVERYEEDKTIVLRLMRREKGSNLVTPAAVFDSRQVQVGKLNGDYDRFAKLLACGAGETLSQIIDRERTELNKQLAAEGDQPESCFILEALKSLSERETSLSSAETLREMPSSPAFYGNSPPKSFAHKKLHSDAVVFTDAFNEIGAYAAAAAVVDEHGSVDDADTVSTVSGEYEHQEHLDVVSAFHSNDSYYFYQADDGQPIYLHSLNARCLMHDYGSLEQSPKTVSGEIVQMETFVMTEDLRRRYRYLAHLPLTTMFNLVEMKFAEGIVSPEALEHFSEEITKRKRLRQRKARDVHRLQQQAQRWEKAVMMDPRNFSRPASTMPSEIPVTTLVKSAQQEIEASFGSPPLADAAVAVSGSPSDEQSALSFAQMLRQGKPKPTGLKIESSPALIQTNASNDATPSLDEYLPPSYRKEFEEAMQAAFDNINVKTVDDDAEAATSGGAKGKKKKQKNKGKLLFATGSSFAPGLH